MANAPAFVVRIDVTRRDGKLSRGTGILVRDAAVLTCEHIVEDAAEIRVFPPYATLPAGAIYLLAHPLGEDMALLEPATPLGIPVAVAPVDRQWKEASGGEPVGIWGFSTGDIYPSAQYISATLRAFSPANARIGITSPVNPGDSGGPVLRNGRVIGLVQGSDDHNQNHALAIPITFAPADLFRPTPVGLPSLPEIFVGRDADVAKIIATFGAKRLVTIVGLPGIGKTECAKAVAGAALTEEWASDGVVYVDLQVAASVSEIKAALIDALNLEINTAEARVLKTMRTRSLFVLNDVHPALRHDARHFRMFVRALHDHTAPARVLITSRQENTVAGRNHDLGALEPQYAAQFLRESLSASGYEYEEGDEDRLTTLVKELDGYPLALTIVANQLQDATLKEVLRRWSAKRTAALNLPGVLDRDLDHLSSVDFALALSIEGLSAQARKLVGAMSLLPAGGKPALFEAVLGDDATEARQSLERAGILRRVDGRYRTYGPVRDFAKRTLEPDIANEIRERVDAYLTQFVADTIGSSQDWRSRSRAASAAITEELPNLHAALDRGINRQDHAFVATLTDKLSPYYTFALAGKEARARLEAGISAAAIAGKRLAEAKLTYALADVGWVTRGIDIFDLYRRAKKLYEDLHEQRYVALCIWSLTFDDLDHERYEQMIERSTDALKIFTDLNDDNGRAQCIKTIGDAERNLERLDDATRHYREALSLFEKSRNVTGLGETYRQLGHVAVQRVQKGKPDDPWLDEAAKLYAQAADQFDKAGYQLGMAHIKFDLATLEMVRGNEQAGLELHKEARREFENVGDMEASARTILALAEHFEGKGDLDRARAYAAEIRTVLPKPPAGLARVIDALHARLTQPKI